ncbi:MAG: hypothetical protein J2P24_03410 [Streptosporangiales bacterium]|nr:hypothetical protein [Streptosporangiales bacterium]MBO0891286.1 hypothetical protein [Acidothermales bacterium]
MHHTNHYYGHAQLMARYAGLPDWRHPPRIWGYLQHGWNVHHGFDPALDLVPGLPKFVWSEAPRAVGQALGVDGYEVVGAPWVYLLAMRPEPDAQPRDGTLFYPFHGWERQRLLGDHAALAATVRETEPGPVTVCLYWLEYQDRAVRRAYERAGCRVITHGPRGSHRRGTDVLFLDRQLTELRRHRRVASNRMSTAVLYGASVGCEVGVYGDPMALDGEGDVFGGVERIRREWPELHSPVVPADLATKVAREELGVDHRRPPEQIRDLFGWQVEPDGSFRTPEPSLEPTRLRAQIRWLDREVQARDDELRRTLTSTSYRVGNAVVRPVRTLLRKGRRR